MRPRYLLAILFILVTLVAVWLILTNGTNESTTVDHEVLVDDGALTASPTEADSDRITGNIEPVSADPKGPAVDVERETENEPFSALNTNCIIKDAQAQLQVRETAGGVIIYTPWANFLVAGLSLNGLAYDPLVRIGGSGSSSGGAHLGGRSLRYKRINGQVYFILDDKLVFSYGNGSLVHGDGSVVKTREDSFGGLVRVDLDELPEYVEQENVSGASGAGNF